MTNKQIETIRKLKLEIKDLRFKLRDYHKLKKTLGRIILR